MRKLSPDILYKGITRPSMKWGMPYQYILTCIVAYPVIAVMNPIVEINIVLLPILVYVGWILGSSDPKLMNIIAVRLRLPKMNPLHKDYWKVKTYSVS